MAKGLSVADIERQLAELQARKKELIAKRGDEIGTLATRCGLGEVDDEILVGAFLEIAAKFNEKGSPAVAQWRTAGNQFLSSGKRGPKTAKSGEQMGVRTAPPSNQHQPVPSGEGADSSE